MFSRNRPHKRVSSMSTINPVSPLQTSFDFQLETSPSIRDFSESFPTSPFTPVSEGSISRPRTSHGVAADGKKPAGLQLLPPIPRIASRQNSFNAHEDTDTQMEASKSSGQAARIDGDSIATTSKKSGPKARSSMEEMAELLPLISGPIMSDASRDSATDWAQTTAGASNPGAPRMESSLFPSRPSPMLAQSPIAAPLPAIAEPMSRSFIDSRDKPYSQPAQRTLLTHQNHSSPNLLQSSSAAQKLRQPTPVYNSNRNWPSSPSSIQNYSSSSTDLSGSTVRPSTKASSSYTMQSSLSNVATVGTPYQTTAASFPLPQLVRTRPKTPGATATVAGVSVPTHHTSGTKMYDKPAEPKKKSRRLNPLSLLQRRKSNQDPEVAVEERATRQAQAQALARQRDVVASGVNKPGPDFDPRIKGRVVHDFSAPRGKRNTFDGKHMPLPPQGIQSANSAPSISPSNAYPPRKASLGSPDLATKGEQRKSVHSPVFVEHLDEHPQASRFVGSIHAESLENKDFLQRASKHSTSTNYSRESKALPPFARRSQILDPTQASFYQDDDSQRSSEPSSQKVRDSTLSLISEVSPINGRSSAHMLDGRASFSPVSPSSPTYTLLPQSTSVASRSYFPEVPGRPVSQLSGSSTPENHQKSPSEVTARPYSVVIAPPVISTISEASAESSPIDSSPRTPRTPLEGHSVAHDASSNNASVSGPVSDLVQSQTQHVETSSTTSPAGQSFIDRAVGIPTPERTPEPDPVQSIQFKPSKDQQKVVEKRNSAAGHSRKTSNGPKHHASNASRFSFQFGSESSAQEQELEQKHRSRQSRDIAAPATRALSPNYDDEDDFFDEDAMDDMDEMEMQAVQPGLSVDRVETSKQSSFYLQQARQALYGHDSDEGSVYDEDNIPEVTNEEDIPYSDHPAFRTHSALWDHSRHNSYLQGGQDAYWRGSTIDHYMRDSCYVAPSTNNSSQTQASGFKFGFDESSRDYLHPNDGLYVAEGPSGVRGKPSVQASTALDEQGTRDVKPALPHRDSGSSERNRLAAGLHYGSPNTASAFPTIANNPEDHGRQNNQLNSFKDSQLPRNAEPDLPKAHDQSFPANAMTVHEGQEPRRQGEYNDEATGVSSIETLPTVQLPLSGTVEEADEGDDTITESSPASLVSSNRRAPTSTINADPISQASRSKASPSKLSSPSTLLTGLGLGNFDFENVRTNTDMLKNDVTRSTKTENLGNSSFDGFEFGEDSSKIHNGRYGTASPPQKAIGSLERSYNGSRDLAEAQQSRFQGRSAYASSPPSNKPLTAAHHSPSQSTLQQSKAFSSLAPIQTSMTPHPPSARNAMPNISTDVQDDMYFDDGNFDNDMNQAHNKSIDENAFDDDGFLARPGMLKAVNHRRDNSGMTFTSSSSDGPYPAFVMPASERASQRLSQLMLEDLPLQAPVDTRYIPQRNPSEDMKRLGQSDRVPPVPVSESNKEAFSRMQVNLKNYHAALAEAANQAAADGRFVRTPSDSTTRSLSSRLKVEGDTNRLSFDNKSIRDDTSMYSNDEDGGNVALPPTRNNKSHKIGRSDTAASHLTHLTTYSPPKMSFDFGFDATQGIEHDLFGTDDDLIAAANAEALASDDEGFYGQEFGFYGRPRANSGDLKSENGGFFGENGDDGLQRNKSLMEPNLTPITERSEFSTRNSFIPGQFGPNSAGPYGPDSPALARMSVAPWYENDITSFDELRRLRASAFGDSNSLRSNSNRSSSNSLQAAIGPAAHTRPSAPGYLVGPGQPVQFGYSTNTSVPGHPAAPQAGYTYSYQESPKSAGSSAGMPFPMDVDVTPKKNALSAYPAEPTTARKVLPSYQTHSRSGSGGDSIGYVQEPDPENNGKPRWVLERRRTSDHGHLELIGREFVGWI